MQHTILIADDHPATRSLLAERLSLDGFQVVLAEDAGTAFERLAQDRPALVLVALALPPAEGQHLAKRIRTSAQGSRAPVVVYDAAHLGKPRGIQAILELGANGYVADPTRHAELLDRIQRLLEAATKTRRASPPVPSAPSAPGRAQPRQQGDLGRGTVATTLARAFRERRTGVLSFADPNGERRVYLLDGVAVAFGSEVRRESLGRWLVETGRLDEGGWQRVLEAMASDGLSQAAALVAVGAVEAGEALYALLTEHAGEMILRTFGLTRGQWSFTDTDGAPDVPALELGGLALVREGARRALTPRFFSDALGPRLDHYPWRTAAFASSLNDLGLGPKELTFAMKISGTVSARDLVTQARSGLKDALLLLWYLEAVGTLGFSETPTEQGADAVYGSVTAVPRKKKPLPPELGDALREEALGILTASYFGALGLEITTDVEAVERAYHDLATRFHPETYEEHELGGLEDLLHTVLERVTAAYRVLSVPEKRKAYLAYLLSRYETAARHTPISVDAEIALKRGNDLMRDGDFTGAEQAFAQAVAANPREPEYYCYLAFARFKAGRGTAEVRAKEPRKLLKKALSLAPDLERALVLLGIVEHEAGNGSAARKYLLKALKLYPGSVTAKAALHRVNRVA